MSHPRKSTLFDSASAAIHTVSVTALDLLGLVAAILFLVVLVVALRYFSQHAVVIYDLGVPQQLNQEGYSSQVAALRLRDVMNQYFREAKTAAQVLPADLSDESLNIVVPKLGNSLDSAYDTLDRIIPFHDRRRITGEFTYSGNELLLQIRVNGALVSTSRQSISKADLKAANILLRQATPAVYLSVHPYIVARHLLMSGNTRDAVRLAALIIGNERESINLEGVTASYYAYAWNDQNVVLARNLLAGIYISELQYDAALNQLKEADRADPGNALTYYNTGIAFASLCKDGAAMSWFLASANLDDDYPFVHNALGNLYRERHEYRDAIQEYQRAIALNPDESLFHEGLGDAYLGIGRVNDATTQFLLSSSLNRKNPGAYWGLGEAYDSKSDQRAEGEYENTWSRDKRNIYDYISRGAKPGKGLQTFLLRHHLDIQKTTECPRR